MLSRLGEKYEIEAESRSKPRAEYLTVEYLQLGLPPAPAAIVGEEVVVQGPNLSEDQVEAAIRRHLGLPDCRQRPKRDSWTVFLNNNSV
jgi:hypothetical protein